MRYIFYEIFLILDKDHLNAVLRVCGTPDAEMMAKIDSDIRINNNHDSTMS